jgi:ATP-dependent HslUV protease ATP-binding subunit HslU
MEKVTEGVSFEAPDLPQDQRRIRIDAEYVRERLRAIMADEDLAKYIL